MTRPRSGWYATLQDAADANGNGDTIRTDGHGTIAYYVTGTFSATVNFEATVDNSNWVPFEVEDLGDTTLLYTTTTGTGIYRRSCKGLYRARSRVSSYSSGAVTVKARVVPL